MSEKDYNCPEKPQRSPKKSTKLIKLKATPPRSQIIVDQRRMARSDPTHLRGKLGKLGKRKAHAYSWHVSPENRNGEACDPRMMDPEVYLPLLQVKRQRLMHKLDHPHTTETEEFDASVEIAKLNKAEYTKALGHLTSIGYKRLDAGRSLKRIGVEVFSRGPPDGLVYLTSRSVTYFEYCTVFTSHAHTFRQMLVPSLFIAPAFDEQTSDICKGCQQWMVLVPFADCNKHSLLRPLMSPGAGLGVGFDSDDDDAAFDDAAFAATAANVPIIPPTL